MKINGKVINMPSVEVIVFPRPDGNLVFKAKPVTKYADFDKICPLPKPAMIMRPGGQTSEDVENPQYKKALNDWAERKSHWMILKSLEATEGLTWDNVDMSNPETYKNYIKELEESGLTNVEVGRLFDIIRAACGLNQDKIDEATKAFLAGEAGL